MLRRISCFAAVFFLLANTCLGNAKLTKITTVEGITEYALPNGLQVLLFPDPSKPTITVNITYRVGSRHEGRGEAGMAHLLEHMVFKGTPSYPNIWGALEDHGATFNGTTWVDRTNYYETLPATEENLDFALKMEADRMVNSLILKEELDKEMTVVRNEFERGENSPTRVLSERMMSSAYLWHNYGKSTIGNRSDIERVPVDNLRRFYKKYYQPDNATLIVTGQFDEQKTLDLISSYFGSIDKPERVLDATYTEEPVQDGARSVTLKRAGDVAAIGLMYHIPAGSHPDFPAIQVLEDIMTSEPSGRLYRRLVPSGLASSVSGYAFPWAEPGIMQFSAQVSEDQDPQAVLNYAIETIEGIKGISDEEVERSKARGLKGFKLAMADSSRIGIRLSESIALGDWRLFFINRDRLGEVSTSAVQTAAEQYLIESNRTSGIFFPAKETKRATIPRTPDFTDLVKNYKGKETIAQGEELKPDADYIESRITRMELPSGIGLTMLAKETRGDAVRMSVRLRFGTQDLLQGQQAVVSMIPSMLMRGTKTKSFQELKDEIDRLESQISFGGSYHGSTSGGPPQWATASIQSDRKNVVSVVKLLSEVMRDPAFDEKEFDTLKNERMAGLMRMKSDPQTLGFTELQRKVFNSPTNSIYYTPTVAEAIDTYEGVTLDSVKQMYAEMYGASDMEIVIVGDFDPEEIKVAIEDSFGDWKSKHGYTRAGRSYIPTKLESLEIKTPDKKMAIVGMGTATETRDDDPEHAALTLASYVLGESAKSRLMNRLRHKGGLSYGAGGSYSTSSIDRVGGLLCYAICAPENAQKAMDAMKDELNKWVNEGITDEELAEAKEGYKQNYVRSIADEGAILSRLLRGTETGQTLKFQAELMAKIEKLTKEEIAAALKKTFAANPMVEIMAGDLDKPAAADGPAEADQAAAAEAPANDDKSLPGPVAQLDKNGDGKIQKSEAPEQVQKVFDKIDTNGDGALDGAEVRASAQGPPPQ